MRVTRTPVDVGRPLDRLPWMAAARDRVEKRKAEALAVSEAIAVAVPETETAVRGMVGDEVGMEPSPAKRTRLNRQTPAFETVYDSRKTQEPTSSRLRRREAADTVQAQDAAGHLIFFSDDLLWCWRCGRYSLQRTHGLGSVCTGTPGAGQAYCLKRLRMGKHLVGNHPFRGNARRLLVA